MLQYVTRSRLRQISLEQAIEGRQRVVRAQGRSPSSNTTFLSHSSEDDDLMPAVVAILENEGATVYLDKLDQRLRSKDPKGIAASLRTSIRTCKKFVLFASPNVVHSRWVPWELGLADGYKNPSNVCLFPSPENANETAWAEQEYLGIYDRIIWGNFTGSEKLEWLVWNQATNNATRLAEWLRQ